MRHPNHQQPHLHNSPHRLYFAASITLIYAAIEASVGWWANSLALLSDAGHMLTDTSALLIASLGAWLAQRRPTPHHSYGLGRAEFLAALINGLLILVMASIVIIHAVERLQQPLPVQGEVVSTVAFIGLVLNVLVLYLLGHSETDLNQRAAALHVLSDLLASIVAILSGLVIIFTGWTLIDPLLSLLIVAFILYSTLRLLREVLHGLMEGVPLELSLTAIGTEMAARPGVLSVHDLHIWSLSSQRFALSAHVVLLDLNQWDSILDDLRHMLSEQYGIDHVTLQPETPARVVHSPSC
ncbi:cation diffusion facilitator family transporter [Nitrosomonas communis]|uniref:Cobalt-zinc-cadmium efflux system protein n=1 Tax=Nitrosomonas communis TaxID=44574 RepID=A0A1H2RBN8_9PROT|nr:cation diffusion facilitator family transporter [Nitrosomonas communis]SDW16893.1 cobalt-zinc-cadmium efflux system protein [Nitrosomonas communis]